ncbi:MAG: FAD-binding oxidoreductase [Hyperionvirus sp.]|uniref:FAD-binding oxidoreductase n=1 Tax=Hyperionvirus sp. TaxID=2487770 RepID=A0A3G5A9C4_9VIRU|nr:MAG: FAD-binding oxidoreductase [Hyperionvirus sp.]
MKKPKSLTNESNFVVPPNELLINLLSCKSKKSLQNMNLELTKAVVNTDLGCLSIGNIISEGTNIYSKLVDSGLDKEEILGLTEKYNVIWPWSLSYSNLKENINKLFVSLPLLIAYPRNSTETSFFIQFAVKHKFKLAIRSGGNCFENYSVDGDVIIDTSLLELQEHVPENNIPDDKKCVSDPKYITKIISSGILIDEQNLTVTVSAGVRLGVVVTELSKKGYVAATGICPAVAVGGNIPTGGVGYYVRKFGLTIDNLIESEIVLADGSILKLSDTSNPDLYRAIKGAGAGNFGIITQFRLKIYPIKSVLFFNITYSINDAVELFDKFQKIILSLSPNFSALVISLSGGLDIISLSGLYVGSNKNKLKALMNYLEIIPLDVVKKDVSPYTAASLFALENPNMPFSTSNSNFIKYHIPSINIQKIVKYLARIPKGLFTGLQFVGWGGEVNRVPADASVFPAREGFIGWLSHVTFWEQQSMTAEALIYDSMLQRLCEEFPVGAHYYGYQNKKNPVNTYFLPEDYSYLMHIKKKYDPHNIFNFGGSIPVE